MPQKRSIRTETLRKRNALSAEEVRVNSHIITEQILKLSEYKKVSQVFLYASIGNEADTCEMIDRMLADGKQIACPRVTGKREMVFQYIHSYKDLKAGYMKIPEPSETAEIADPAGIDTLMIVPGVAFDANGGRIGYGGGFYDTYLQRYPDIITAAIAFSVQIVEDVHREEHDVCMRHVITEKGILL